MSESIPFAHKKRPIRSKNQRANSQPWFKGTVEPKNWYDRYCLKCFQNESATDQMQLEFKMKQSV